MINILFYLYMAWAFTFWHLYIKRAIMVRATWIAYWPFTRTFSMSVPFTKKS